MHRIDLWIWALEGGELSLLSQDERERAKRFVFERDRLRYISGRARLREILAGYLGDPPESLRFCYGVHGRPSVAGLSFSLSHTGSLAALAVGPDMPLGLDIEAIRPVEDAVARHHFAPGEYAALSSLPPGDRALAFHRCWTRKEAYLKARGTGLATDLKSFEVSLGPVPRLLLCKTEDVRHWILVDIPVADGVAGALAVRAEGRPVTVVERTSP